MTQHLTGCWSYPDIKIFWNISQGGYSVSPLVQVNIKINVTLCSGRNSLFISRLETAKKFPEKNKKKKKRHNYKLFQIKNPNLIKCEKDLLFSVWDFSGLVPDPTIVVIGTGLVGAVTGEASALAWAGAGAKK